MALSRVHICGHVACSTLSLLLLASYIIKTLTLSLHQLKHVFNSITMTQTACYVMLCQQVARPHSLHVPSVQLAATPQASAHSHASPAPSATLPPLDPSHPQPVMKSRHVQEERCLLWRILHQLLSAPAFQVQFSALATRCAARCMCNSVAPMFLPVHT